jgi:diacylglycerol kinase family enzyme
LTFAAEVVRALIAHHGRYEPLIRIDGHGDAALLFVGNGRPYTFAGALALPIVPQADFARGLAVVAPRRITPALLPWLAPTILFGRARPSRRLLVGADLDAFDVSCVRPLPLQVDGEDLGDVERVAFASEREAVAVLA